MGENAQNITKQNQQQQQQDDTNRAMRGGADGSPAQPLQAMAPGPSSAKQPGSSGGGNVDAREELDRIRNLLWGSEDSIRFDVFQRWSQGFEFSDVEPSALVQKQGGPCAVIAPVQAYLLKIILSEESGGTLKDLPVSRCRRSLVKALCEILKKCNAPYFRIVTLPFETCTEAKELDASVSPQASVESASNSREQATPNNLNDISTISAASEDAAIEVSPDEYHRRLHVLQFRTAEEVQKFYEDNYDRILSAQYGVLLFLYTVLLTKGENNVNAELLDPSEPLIHRTYGYGGQALVNLMLTGRAVPHVWDNDQDVGGLKLPGISEQSDIGFITLMEQMRYCTVGSFLKNPRHPVWVMGSETHFTVLFSDERRLVSPETPSEIARRVFKSYDPDGNNFIPTSMLGDVLAALNLVSEPEYVDIMQKRLDPENLGIILMNAFMEEFFQEERSSMPDTFDLMHYNGIPGSNEGSKVRYNKGSAILLESDLRAVCTSNPMMTCLQTKWPNIEINWHEMRIPSLN